MTAKPAVRVSRGEQGRKTDSQGFCRNHKLTKVSRVNVGSVTENTPKKRGEKEKHLHYNWTSCCSGVGPVCERWALLFLQRAGLKDASVRARANVTPATRLWGTSPTMNVSSANTRSPNPHTFLRAQGTLPHFWEEKITVQNLRVVKMLYGQRWVVEHLSCSVCCRRRKGKQQGFQTSFHTGYSGMVSHGIIKPFLYSVELTCESSHNVYFVSFDIKNLVNYLN